jgi:hypothetical protein
MKNVIKIDGFPISLRHYSQARKNAAGNKVIYRKNNQAGLLPKYLVETNGEFQPAASMQNAPCRACHAAAG